MFSQTPYFTGFRVVLKRTSFSLLLLMVALLAPKNLPGQAIPPRDSEFSRQQGQDSRQVWPAPIRPTRVSQADHTELVPGSSVWVTPYPHDVLPLNALRDTAMQQPHQIIRSPSHRTGHTGQQSVTAHRHLSHHIKAQQSAAVLPDAVERKVWKAPYSYGYFGASGSRHWSRHFGYRDRYTEWRLR